MKTYTKKYLAMLLVFVMTLTVLPWNVFALDGPAVINPGPQTMKFGESLNLTVTGSFDHLNAKVTNGTGEVSVVAPTDTVNNSAPITINALKAGTATITLIGKLGNDEDTQNFTVTVEKGELTVNSPLKITQGENGTFTVTDSTGKTVDNATLTMTDTGLTVNGLTVTAPADAAAKTYSGTITAGDNYNAKAVTVEVKEKPKTQVTVSFNSDGAKEGNPAAQTIDSGGKITLPKVTKEGFEFSGWKNPDTGNIASENDTYTKSVTLTAQWKAAAKKDIQATPTELTFTVGDAAKEIQVTDPANGGFQHSLSGDCVTVTVNNGKITVTPKSAGTANLTLTANGYNDKVIQITVNEKTAPPARKEYVVTFVSNGGTAVASQGTINQKLATLPAPTRVGYTFDGWYTKADFTSPRVTTSTLFTDNTTLYAKWILVTDQVKLRNVTWDSNGVKGYTNVPNATVVLYRYSDNVEVARTTSDSNGYFSIATDFFNKYWYGNNYWHDNNYWWYDGYYYNGHTYREAKDFYDEYGYWPSWWRDGYYYGYRGNYGYLIGSKSGYLDSAKEYVGSNYWYDSDYWWDGRYWNDRNWWYDSDREANYRIYPTNIDRGNYWVSGYTNYSNTRVYVYDGNTYLGSTTTDRSGYFKLTWDSPSVSTTRTLQYYIYGSYSDNRSEYSIVPVATSAEAGSRTVKGKAGDYAKVVLFDKSGVKLGETTADKNGNFSIYTSRALIAGETLTMTAEESTKKVSTGSVIVPGAAVSAVLSAQNRPYVTGYPDGNFRPQGNVTRAEAAQMFATLLNGGTNFGTSAQTSFKDANNAWYSPAINYVTQKGLIKGFENGTFRPNQYITRAEFAQMISGYLQKGFAGTGELKDVKGHWAQDAIDKVYGNKNVAGYPDGTFKPNREITRAEAVTILNSVFNREASAKTIANNGAKTFRDVNASFWAYYQILDAANGHLGN